MVDGKMQDLLKQTFALKPRHGQQMTKDWRWEERHNQNISSDLNLIDLSCIPKTKAQVICAHYLPIVSI